jgi:5-methylthioadenosine/S-adenosylhomocysteine deaminase
MTPPIACDILLRAGTAVLGDDTGGVLRDAAIAVDAGRILDIGPHDALAPRYAPRRRIGSAAHIALPGLVNTHNHTPLALVRGRVEDRGFAPAYLAGVPQGDALSAEEAYLLARLGVYELLRFGTTTLVDFYRHPEALARAAAEAGLRGFVGGRIMDVDTTRLGHGERCHDPALGRAMLAETESFLAGWTGRHPLITPALGPHAADTCSPALLAEVAALARATGLGVHTHLHQSPAEVEVVQARDGCRPVEVFDRLGLLGPRLLAGHCIWMQPDDIARVGACGAAVAHAPIGNAAHGAIAPARALEAAGACISLCTDTKSGDMFEAMRCAVQVARIRGAGFGFGAADALRWATRGGAAALGLDDVGALIPGWRADIVLLDATMPNLRPLSDGPGLIVHSANGGNVEYVVVDGALVLDAGRPCRFDATEVIAAAQAVTERLWQQAERT